VLRAITKWVLAIGIVCSSWTIVSDRAFSGAKDIVIGIAEDFTTLDPHNAIDNLSLSAERMMTEGLFGFDRDMHVVPVLAEEYEVSPDVKQFTITLKRGIKFHDGTDFNAAAVKASFDRVTNPENKLRRYVLFSNIQRTEVVDDYTVKLSLAKPFASMINVLAHPAAAIISPTALELYGKDVNAGQKLHRRAGVKMHHGLRRRAGPVQVSDVQTQLSCSIDEPAFPSRPASPEPRRAA